jgi:hypothetical protein
VVPVYSFKDAGIIRSGGIEVQGLKASAIARRKPPGMPVLEKYVFIPNSEPESLNFHTALRACIHIILENQLGSHVKTIELPHPDTVPLSPTLARILEDLPLIQASAQLEFLRQAICIYYHTTHLSLIDCWICNILSCTIHQFNSSMCLNRKFLSLEGSRKMETHPVLER